MQCCSDTCRLRLTLRRARRFARLDVAPGDPLSPVVVSYKKLCRDAEASSGGALPAAAPSFPVRPNLHRRAAPRLLTPLHAQREGGAAKTSPEEVRVTFSLYTLALTLVRQRAEGDVSGVAGEEGDEEDESSSDEGGSDEGDEEGSQDEGGSGSESAGQGPADWYDVDDAFIDDSEILEVPEESAGKAKHNGFFVNKARPRRSAAPAPSFSHATQGEIERERQPGVPAPPVGATKKRKHEGVCASSASRDPCRAIAHLSRHRAG